MKIFYENMNILIYKHPFVKGCIYFVSRFCPYMIVIFYSLFLLKIYIEWESHLFYFIKNPILAVISTIILKIIFNRKRPCQKYNIKPVDDLKRKRDVASSDTASLPDIFRITLCSFLFLKSFSSYTYAF